MAMDNFSIKFRVFTGKFSRLMSQFSRLFVRFIYQYTVYHFNSTTHTRGSYFMLNTKEINSCFKLASKKSSFLQETDCANVTKVKMIVKLLPAVGKLARQNRMQILRPHKSRQNYNIMSPNYLYILYLPFFSFKGFHNCLAYSHFYYFKVSGQIFVLSTCRCGWKGTFRKGPDPAFSLAAGPDTWLSGLTYEKEGIISKKPIYELETTKTKPNAAVLANDIYFSQLIT